MSVEELRKKRAQLKANSDITFNNMQVIADESLRVAEVAHNSREILENLDAEFERQTGLDKTDFYSLLLLYKLEDGLLLIR